MRLSILATAALFIVLACGEGGGSGSGADGGTPGSGGEGDASGGSDGDPAGASGVAGTAGNAVGGDAAGGADGEAGNDGSGASAGAAGAAACDDAAACGGDIVGSWRIVAACFDDHAGADPLCAAGELGYTSFRVDGVFSFQANGTYTHVGSASVAQSHRIPVECPARNCGSLSAAYETRGGACDTTAAECRCELERESAIDTSGTYTLAGTTLALNGGTPEAYCVRGSRLWFRNIASVPDIEAFGVWTELPGTLVLDRID